MAKRIENRRDQGLDTTSACDDARSACATSTPARVEPVIMSPERRLKKDVNNSIYALDVATPEVASL